jgi:hypothetical protein
MTMLMRIVIVIVIGQERVGFGRGANAANSQRSLQKNIVNRQKAEQIIQLY